IPYRTDVSTNATIELGGYIKARFNCGGSVYDRKLNSYTSFTINIETPEILPAFDAHNQICADANDIDILSYFTTGKTSVTGVTFSIINSSTNAVIASNVTQIKPSTLTAGVEYKLRASKTYSNGTYTQEKLFT